MAGEWDSPKIESLRMLPTVEDTGQIASLHMTLPPSAR